MNHDKTHPSLLHLFQAKMETKALKAKRPGFTDERYLETAYFVENGGFCSAELHDYGWYVGLLTVFPEVATLLDSSCSSAQGLNRKLKSNVTKPS